MIVKARLMPEVGNLSEVVGFIKGKEHDVTLTTEEN